MLKKIQLQIPEPCHEDWEKMTPDNLGRFCGSCQKGVIDFTDMSDSQLVAFFKKPSTDSVCGRFAPDQLERDILIPGKRIPWMKYFFQIAIPAFLFSQKAKAQGQVMLLKGDTVLVESGSLMGKSLVSSERPDIKKKGIVQGRIVDDEGNRIPYASIIIKGTNTGTATDSIGNFKIELNNSKEQILLVSSCVGFLPVEKTVNVSAGSLIEINMTANHVANDEVVVTGYGRAKDRMVMGSLSTIRKTSGFLKIKEFFVKDSINIFPNPAKRGQTINIKWEKATAGEYRIDFYYQQGQLVQSVSVKIESDFFAYSFKLPSIPAGIYFLKMTNKNTGSQNTEKVIIQ